MPKSKIAQSDLNLAASHLDKTLRLNGARAANTRIRQRKAGLYAMATVNGIDVETFLPFGSVEWATIARQMIAIADAAGGVAQVM